MWLLVKSELKYNGYTLTLLALIMVLYSIFSLLNLQIIHEENFSKDLWSGLFSFVIAVLVLSVWGQRIKEIRNRFFSLLPLSVKHISYGRFLFASLPFLVIILYLIFIHFIIVGNQYSETSSNLVQIGVMFVMFAGFIRARDDWFSHWNFGKRTQAAFISVSIIQIVVVAIFLNISKLYKDLTPIFGDLFYFYVKTIFFLLGLIIMVTTIYSYQKRKSYLG